MEDMFSIFDDEPEDDKVITIRPYKCDNIPYTRAELPFECDDVFYCGAIYMHGKLYDDMHTDLVQCMYNIPSDKIRHIPNWSSIDNEKVISLVDEHVIESCPVDEFWKNFNCDTYYLEGGYPIRVQGVDRECFGFFHTKWEKVCLDAKLISKLTTGNKCIFKDALKSYVWNIPRVSGLVVYADDIADVLDAARKYVGI